MNATKTQDKHKVKNQWRLSILLIFSMVFSLFTTAQVTVGASEVPQEFSILEIESNTGGLRLPHLSTPDRDAMEKSAAFQGEIVGKGKGLTIYNTTTNCVEYWNSSKWISLCDGDTNIVTPPVATPVGSGTFSGKTCFDVVVTNPGGGCGTTASRLSQKANFAQTATNTQAYTFKTDGTVSKIRFYAVDASGQVIDNITPGSPLWETATNLNGRFTLTVKYKSDLNTTARGRNRDNALIAVLYVVYNDNAAGTGTDRHLELRVSVQDCSCCPGYLAKAGEYVKNDPASYLPGFSTGNRYLVWSQITPRFTATGRDLCFYKRDAVDVPTSTVREVGWISAVWGCESGVLSDEGQSNSSTAINFIDEEYRSMGGWRLPNMAELAAISNVAQNLSAQPNAVSGTQNFRTNYYWSININSHSMLWAWSYDYGGSGIATQDSALGKGYWARCVRTF